MRNTKGKVANIMLPYHTESGLQNGALFQVFWIRGKREIAICRSKQITNCEMILKESGLYILTQLGI